MIRIKPFLRRGYSQMFCKGARSRARRCCAVRAAATRRSGLQRSACGERQAPPLSHRSPLLRVTC
eukprot:scaffold271569_cov30-Tisochrysis_lutea.AAC.1